MLITELNDMFHNATLYAAFARQPRRVYNECSDSQQSRPRLYSDKSHWELYEWVLSLSADRGYITLSLHRFFLT